MTPSIHPALLIALLVFSWPHKLHAQWLPTNGPLGGPARSLASNGTFLFAELHGGVFRSGDNGENWTRLKIGMPAVNASLLVASGADIYAGTWGNGVYRSTDNGEHWISDTTVLRKGAIDFIVIYGSDIITGTVSNGVYRSTDRGASWREMNAGLSSDDRISRVAVGGGYLVGCTWGGRLYRYCDIAGTWSRIDSIRLHGRIGASVVVNGSDIVVGWEKGVARSTDNGTSWSMINAGLATTDSHPFAVGGRLFNATLYDARFYLLDTIDMTWRAASTGMNNTRVGTMTAIGDMLFACTSDGIYRSTDNGAHWTLVNQGMVAAHVTALAAIGTTVVAGTHAGGVHLTTDHGANWSSVGTGLPHLSPVTAFLLQDSAILAGTMYEGVYRSTDYGASWHEINNGLTDSTITALAANDSYLFAATREGGGIFRSDDNGEEWTDTDLGLTSPIPSVTALAVSGSTIIAGIDGEGVYRSTDNGKHWNKVSSGLPSVWYVSSIASNGSSMVLADRSGIYYSSNNGAVWAKSGLNVWAYSVISAAADSSSTFLVTTMNRVLSSSDGGRTWKQLKERTHYGGLLAASSTDLFMGTSGWGVLRQPLSEISVVLPTRLLAEVDTGNSTTVLNNGRVNYRLNRPEVVGITIYDSLGHIVARPVVEMVQKGGQHSVLLLAEELALGSYRCTITVGGVERSVRFVVVR
jgi:photosystem II stability/assembly factor-like uncharacterized protein